MFSANDCTRDIIFSSCRHLIGSFLSGNANLSPLIGRRRRADVAGTLYLLHLSDVTAFCVVTAVMQFLRHPSCELQALTFFAEAAVTSVRVCDLHLE